MSSFRLSATVLAATVCSVLPAQDAAVSLPSDQGQWLNSPPISAAAMKGKGAVLYFFEES